MLRSIINFEEFQLNLVFFSSLVRNFVFRFQETLTKTLQIESVTDYDTNNATNKCLEGGSISAKRDPYPLAGMAQGIEIRGGPNPLCDAGSHLGIRVSGEDTKASW